MSNKDGTTNDGGLVWGGQIATIAGVQFVVESGSAKVPSSWMVQKNEDGVPVRQAGTKDVPTANIVVQLVDATTVTPPLFVTIALKMFGGGTKTFILSDASEAFGHDTESKVTLEARLQIGSGQLLN